MKQNIRIIVNSVWIVIGAVLIGLAFAGKVDEFWNGMGSALLVVGILNMLRCYRFNKNAAYREKVQVEQNDERHLFIRNKAWAWAGYLFVLTAAVLSIVLRIIHQDLLSMAASGAVCLVILLYWISYVILKKKY